jgi:hypothetical protein
LASGMASVLASSSSGTGMRRNSGAGFFETSFHALWPRRCSRSRGRNSRASASRRTFALVGSSTRGCGEKGEASEN